MKIEICTDSITGANLAANSGAHRIELCSGLTLGGLTPSYSLSAKCAQIIETHVMIRHREGDFFYHKEEIKLMAQDIHQLAASGIHGVVFGCLTKDFNLDIEACKFLLAAAKEQLVEVTFHRAFDFCESPIEMLHQLIELGFNRILTSGMQPTAIEGADLIKKLVREAQGKIQIMAGSGVNASNALELAETGIDALHFSSHKSRNAFMGMGLTNSPDKTKVESIVSLFS
ncbi:MAG: copper homeostasis protein CutC [Flavobacteriales bacterium]|nr:copper homeostasis protein CutC [Flavobacteriales bacterium]